MAINFLADRMKSVYGVISTVTSTSAAYSAAVDHTGFDTLFVVIDTGVSTGNTVTPAILEGTTSTPRTAVTLNTALSAIDNTAAGQTLLQFDISGLSQYFCISMTPSTTTSLTYSVAFLLGNAKSDPASGTAGTIYRKA